MFIFLLEYFIGLIAIGIAVGFVSGLLGVGGGFLLVPFQFFLLNYLGVDPSISLKIAMGTSLAIISPTGFFSAYNHYKKDKFNLKPGIILGCFGLIGGLIGGAIAVNADSAILQIIIGIVFLILAINMFFNKSGSGKGEKNSNDEILVDDFSSNWKQYIYIGLTGVGVGILSGLFSIGGGAFLIPILVYILGYSMIRSIRTSSVFISITAIGGVLPYLMTHINTINLEYSIGYINIVNFIVIALFSIPLTYFGTKYAYKLKETQLNRLFAIILAYMALKILGLDPLSFLF
ncbi:MAG: sulfite exporter TauE/SafE family protein [Methanobrevibacter sp.]|nr:sulfite exporter TauE/SafE family protein [Methanobrevibacter sp.]